MTDKPSQIEIGRNVLVECTDDALTIRIDLNHREGWERYQSQAGQTRFRRWIANSSGFRWVQIPDPEGIFRDSRILLSVYAFERATPDMEPGLYELTEEEEQDKRLIERWRERRKRGRLREAIERMRSSGDDEEEEE